MRPDDDSGAGVLAFPAADAADPVIPDLPRLPDTVEEPASVSQEPRRDGAGLGVVTDARYATVDAIPGRALTAYQRAETVMRQADPSCNLSWQLVAAIGKVESNHGRFAGALMTADGVVHPAILGPQLTGRGATSRIDDTDAGLLDGDERFDRAVGPMQFIPSTWTLVGVDADGDGRRDPQDIDDASLATGVYLCSGTDDLATGAGQRAAVHRYNHSSSYVDLVLSIMAGYLHADPALFRVIGGSGVLDPDDYPTGGGGTPTSLPSEPQPTFDVVDPSQSPTSTGHRPRGQLPSPPSSPPRPRPSDPRRQAHLRRSRRRRPRRPRHPRTRRPPRRRRRSRPRRRPPPHRRRPRRRPRPRPPRPPRPTTPTATASPTDGPTDPGDPGDPGDPVVPQELLDAWDACLAAGVDPADLVGMTACLVEVTGLPADDPGLLALLANPPVTPPAPTQTTQQPRVRRRRAS